MPPAVFAMIIQSLQSSMFTMSLLCAFSQATNNMLCCLVRALMPQSLYQRVVRADSGAGEAGPSQSSTAPAAHLCSVRRNDSVECNYSAHSSTLTGVCVCVLLEIN